MLEDYKKSWGLSYNPDYLSESENEIDEEADNNEHGEVEQRPDEAGNVPPASDPLDAPDHSDPPKPANPDQLTDHPNVNTSDERDKLIPDSGSHSN